MSISDTHGNETVPDGVLAESKREFIHDIVFFDWTTTAETLQRLMGDQECHEEERSKAVAQPGRSIGNSPEIV